MTISINMQQTRPEGFPTTPPPGTAAFLDIDTVVQKVLYDQEVALKSFSNLSQEAQGAAEKLYPNCNVSRKIHPYKCPQTEVLVLTCKEPTSQESYLPKRIVSAGESVTGSISGAVSSLYSYVTQRK